MSTLDSRPRPLSYRLEATDPRCRARAGVISTPHGDIQTPIFMPVGTQGAVRNLTPDQVVAAGAQIILANTYHMSIRPGEDLVKKAGGLHPFMGYKLPILTDSGGFQVFSLPKKEITDEGVAFNYKVDGQRVLLTPERSMEVQQALGADIAMAFDECAPYPCSYEYALEALERTTAWEKRSRAAHTRPDQALFGIVQGSTFQDLRERSAREITAIDFDGFAIGGLSVGEGLEIMSRVLSWVTPFLPEDKPRYLMGVGLPEDLFAGVERGVDMFDCVIPTRHARGGILYTFQGRMRVQHARYRKDMYPIDTTCACYTCQRFSRAYLRHLFMIKEVLANTLASIHNIHFLLELTRRMRLAILEGRFLEYKREFFERYKPGEGDPTAMLDDELEAPVDYDDEDTDRAPRGPKNRSNPASREAHPARDTRPQPVSRPRGSYEARGDESGSRGSHGARGGQRTGQTDRPAQGGKARGPQKPFTEHGSSGGKGRGRK